MNEEIERSFFAFAFAILLFSSVLVGLPFVTDRKNTCITKWLYWFRIMWLKFLIKATAMYIVQWRTKATLKVSERIANLQALEWAMWYYNIILHILLRNEANGSKVRIFTHNKHKPKIPNAIRSNAHTHKWRTWTT